MADLPKTDEDKPITRFQKTNDGRMVCRRGQEYFVIDLETGKPWDLQTRSYLLAATPEVQEDLMKLLSVETRGC